MNIETSTRNTINPYQRPNAELGNVVVGRHVQTLVQSVRINFGQLSKSIARENGEPSILNSPGKELSSDSQKPNGSNGMVKRVDTSDVDADAKRRTGFSENVSVSKQNVNTLNAPSRAVVQNSVVPAELQTLIQMLMTFFGSGHIGDQDKRKIMAFIRELITLGDESGSVELIEGLFNVLNKGLLRLRVDADVIADDLEELESIITRPSV